LRIVFFHQANEHLGGSPDRIGVAVLGFDHQDIDFVSETRMVAPPIDDGPDQGIPRFRPPTLDGGACLSSEASSSVLSVCAIVISPSPIRFVVCNGSARLLPCGVFVKRSAAQAAPNCGDLGVVEQFAAGQAASAPQNTVSMASDSRLHNSHRNTKRSRAARN
jgi:hypothetical protein